MPIFGGMNSIAMQKYFSLLILFFSISLTGFAQSDLTSRKFGDRLFAGGDVGLTFGTVTFINVSPLLGYRITDDFSAGVGGTYQYFKQSFDGAEFQTSIYGGRVFARHAILEDFFVHSEYEILNLEVADAFGFATGRQNIPFLYVGGGVRQSIGGSSYFVGMVLYDVIQNRLSPYNPLQIRGGFIFGL